MGVGGVTVPSTATPLETALMAFMQQNAADRQANRQANEARDAIMTGLLGVCPALYHDCDDEVLADLYHDQFQNIALVRNGTLVNRGSNSFICE